MSDAWPLHLTVDAHGCDDSFVRIRRTAPDGPTHLSVRVGSVLVYCLDAGAVTAMAAAWARAHASSADLLPITSSQPRPLATRSGYASPAAHVVAEGTTRWNGTPPRPGHPYTEVTSNWLTVGVHDSPGLRPHPGAGAQAAARGQHGLPRPPVPFRRLLDAANAQEQVNRYRADHPGWRGR